MFPSDFDKYVVSVTKLHCLRSLFVEIAKQLCLSFVRQTGLVYHSVLMLPQLWDVRTQAPILSFSHHEDFISDFAVDEANTTLLAAGYDDGFSSCCSCEILFSWL